jgi:hypothetical protein
VSRPQGFVRCFRSRAPTKIAGLVARLRSRGGRGHRKPWFDAQRLGGVQGATSPEKWVIYLATAATCLRRFGGRGILGQRVIDG